MDNEPFVNDVRASDDQSLNLIPRITNFAELKQHFGLDVDRSLGAQAANPGERYWRLVGFEVRTGPKVYMPQIKQANGQAANKIVVFRHYPSAPAFPQSVSPSYFNNGVGGFTDVNGVIGFEYTETSVTGANGGPDYIWVSADPPGGSRVASDMAIRLGWIGGTPHLTPNPIFQDVEKESNGNPPPSTGQSELRVYDGLGQYIGRAILTKGSGSGRRIALFENGVEAGHTVLVD